MSKAVARIGPSLGTGRALQAAVLPGKTRCNRSDCFPWTALARWFGAVIFGAKFFRLLRNLWGPETNNRFWPAYDLATEKKSAAECAIEVHAPKFWVEACQTSATM